ncbi:MAG TPA: hypothetical protein VGP07_19640 [Polyangia bacterium]|jgi:hypothetical protein
MLQRLGVGSVAVALCASACAVYTSGIHADAPLHQGSAYLYGRFFMNALPDESGGKQSVGLVLRCERGSSYTFGSMDQRDVRVLEIKPSRCWLMKAVLADQNGIVRKELKTDPTLLRPLDFTAGRAHYIGDYFAKGDYSVQMAANTQTWDWAMSSAAGDHYADTTAEMRRAFPNLASLPTDDLRLIPERAHKRGNGIGPSPGEPPLSPPLVAFLAPFIKRSYPTPAQCEAACPTGQCLPYRGPSGPEMACVIRCNRNADCPTGLACSCPNSESPAGPDCHPIARRPKDPLDRLCLPPETAGQP